MGGGRESEGNPRMEGQTVTEESKHTTDIRNSLTCGGGSLRTESVKVKAERSTGRHGRAKGSPPGIQLNNLSTTALEPNNETKPR